MTETKRKARKYWISKRLRLLFIHREELPLRMAFHPYNQRFSITWNAQNKRMRRLHILIRILCLVIERNNGYTRVGTYNNYFICFTH